MCVPSRPYLFRKFFSLLYVLFPFRYLDLRDYRAWENSRIIKWRNRATQNHHLEESYSLTTNWIHNTASGMKKKYLLYEL